MLQGKGHVHRYSGKCSHDIPYCPKFLWDFIFANFVNGFRFAKFYSGILAWPGFLD